MSNQMQKTDVILGCESGYNEAVAVVFGAPFDGTTSYRPGTRMAGRVIRSESYGFETYSPYQEKDLTDYKIHDAGELDLCFGNTEKVLADIERFTSKILADEKKPIMIGGEHLVTLGAIRAAAKKYPDLCVLHFDAHADLRDDYLGEKLSHASVIRRTWDILGDGRIYQYGIRSGDRPEFEWAKQGHVNLNKFDFANLNIALNEIGNKPLYFTLDLDVLDPSVLPGTGTPEPGGVSFLQLLEAVLKLKNMNIIGCDIVELAPHYDTSGASTAAAFKILREILLTIL